MNRRLMQGLLMVLFSLQISNAQIVKRDTAFDEFYAELDKFNKSQIQELARTELSAVANKIDSNMEHDEIKYDLKFVQDILLYYRNRYGRDVAYHFLSGGVYYYDGKYFQATVEFSMLRKRVGVLK